KKIPLVTYINQDDKNALNDFIEKEHINPSTYYYAKVLFFLENKKIFTFNEQMELRKQAQNYSLDFEEYIMLKIKN
ncbi:hypothetical protein HL736_001185, partial [Campylobacter lari]|nr:hypothetical protein [Campylobacter lari]